MKMPNSNPQLGGLLTIVYDVIALKKELWWYPYSDKVYKQTLKMMRWIFR